MKKRTILIVIFLSLFLINNSLTLAQAQNLTLEWKLLWVKRLDPKQAIIYIVLPEDSESKDSYIMVVSTLPEIFLIHVLTGDIIYRSGEFTPPKVGLPTGMSLYTDSSEGNRLVAWIKIDPKKLEIYDRRFGNRYEITLDYTSNPNPIAVRISENGKYVFIGDNNGFLAAYVSLAIRNEFNFLITVDSRNFRINLVSDSDVSGFAFQQQQKQLVYTVNSIRGNIGFSNISIPKLMMNGTFTVLVDDNIIPFTLKENSTHTALYFTYVGAPHTIKIKSTVVIPEFPSLSLLIMSMIAALIFLSLIEVFRKRGYYNKRNLRYIIDISKVLYQSMVMLLWIKPNKNRKLKILLLILLIFLPAIFFTNNYLAYSIGTNSQSFNLLQASNIEWRLLWVKRLDPNKAIIYIVLPEDSESKDSYIMVVSTLPEIFLIHVLTGDIIYRSGEFTPPKVGLPTGMSLYTDSSEGNRLVAWISINPTKVNLFDRKLNLKSEKLVDYTDRLQPIALRISENGRFIFIGDNNGFLAVYEIIRSGSFSYDSKVSSLAFIPLIGLFFSFLRLKR